MKISYYLNSGREKNLYCRITDGSERVTFSLGYSIPPKDWDEKNEELPFNNEYYYTLGDFKSHLEKRYHELKSQGKDQILHLLKNEATNQIEKKGLEEVARRIFNEENSQDQMPSYDNFVKAFQQHTGLKKGEYKVQPVGHTIHFHTPDTIFEIETREGMTSFLKRIVESRSYDEIALMTVDHLWVEIYTEPGIQKADFLPDFLNEWEIYWDTTYEQVQASRGRTNHLDKMKEQSWRAFQVLLACYDSRPNPIELALNVDIHILHPTAILAMLRHYAPQTCYEEYCDLFFDQQEWQTIVLGYLEDSQVEADESNLFYIREIDR